MTHLSLLFFNDPAAPGPYMWIFLTISVVAMFVFFIPFITFVEGRRKEREAFYKAETLRRVAEASGESAKAALELLREEHRLETVKKVEGLKIGGLVNIAVGVALIVFLRVLTGGGSGSPFLVGLIPCFIGIALLVYALFLAAKPDSVSGS
jgi:Domain of unknown function (DUF6249)